MRKEEKPMTAASAGNKNGKVEVHTDIPKPVADNLFLKDSFPRALFSSLRTLVRTIIIRYFCREAASFDLGKRTNLSILITGWWGDK